MIGAITESVLGYTRIWNAFILQVLACADTLRLHSLVLNTLPYPSARLLLSIPHLILPSHEQHPIISHLISGAGQLIQHTETRSDLSFPDPDLFKAQAAQPLLGKQINGPLPSISYDLTVASIPGCDSTLHLDKLTLNSPPYTDWTKSCVAGLQSYYEPYTGLYNSTGWWNTANLLTILIHAASLPYPALEKDYVEAVLTNTYERASKTDALARTKGHCVASRSIGKNSDGVARRSPGKAEQLASINDANDVLSLMVDEMPSSRSLPKPRADAITNGFLNEFYDDEGWWALAWLDAWDLTHNETYLDTAKVLFQDMCHGIYDEAKCHIPSDKDKDDSYVKRHDSEPTHAFRILTTSATISKSGADIHFPPPSLPLEQSNSHERRNGSCKGGLWWNKSRTAINAIENELYMHVASSLSNRVHSLRERQAYRRHAEQSWDWFLNSGLINTDNCINDGLDLHTCKNNGGIVWTYNQGVVLGALVELDLGRQSEGLESQQAANPTFYPPTQPQHCLHRDQNSPDYTQYAHLIAAAALSNLTSTAGILHEPCEPNCGQDGPQFKGIFMRNLHRLHAHSPRLQYEQSIRSNAASTWRHNRHDLAFGLVWSGPFQHPGAAAQGSACDVLIAAAFL